MAEDRMSGGCACGKVRFTANIADDDAYLCHCRMCQRATGSVSIAFKNIRQADIEWESGPDWYDSSPIATRPFCSACGTSLGFQFKEGSENLDVTVAAFDDPARFTPKHHFGAESMHRQWINTEGLPEQRTDTYQKLIDKWVAATGSVPG
ncbi:GFA family protein [Sphingomonas sp.]|uniref:GFA family protein n=1 Tax=Sphingomonas sp. TaxID=28214 RepID=UPI00286E6C8D|nr:GFA family protein [Sphingomonas sp.]